MLLTIFAASALISLTHSLPPQTPLPVPTSNPHVEAHKTHAHDNAPQIFNALHSSLRQWGSSLQHNGMSFFPASIPEHTLLYHGTGSPTPPEGMEWLAFEIEHAQMFARPTMPGGRHPP